MESQPLPSNKRKKVECALPETTVWFPRTGLGLKQVSFCRPGLVQVFLFVTNNLSETPFVGNTEETVGREKEL